MAKNPPWLRALRASLSPFCRAIRRCTSMGPGAEVIGFRHNGKCGSKRSPEPWDQPIADTCRIFVVAWEFFSEGSLLDLNTNREHSKQDTSPEKPPPGT